MLTALFAIDETNRLEVQRKTVLLRIIYAMTFLVLPPYMFMAFYNGLLLTGIFDIVALILMILTLVYHEKTGDFQTPGYLVSLFFGALFLYLTATGGVGNTGPLWSHALLLLLVFLLGKKKGSIGVIIYIALTAILLFVPGVGLMTTDYPFSFKFRFITSLLLIYGLSYFIESVRERTHATISAKNNELKATITALTQAEAESARLQDELLAARKLEAIGTLAGGMAHEFNNQVSVIMGNTDLLIRNLPEDEDVDKKMNAIRLASERIASLTDQLLSFSRKQILQLEVVNLNQLIESSHAVIKKKLCPGFKLEFDLQKDIFKIEVDREQILQVLIHLVSNACDAMCGLELGTLIIKTENVILDDYRSTFDDETRNGRFVCLSVIDSGVGMNEAMIQKIFDPFFTTKQQGFGIGLGLSFVYGTIKQHEGWPEVSSVPGQGTVFRVFFPACLNENNGSFKDKFRLLSPTNHI